MDFDLDELDDLMEQRMAEGGELTGGLAELMAGSGKKREVTLTTKSGASMTMAVEADTKVGDLKEQIAEKTLVDKSDLKFLDGETELDDTALAKDAMTVLGTKDFEVQKRVWPHPIGIIGQGYHGLKTAMTYMMDGTGNIVCFDRNDKVGGYCWITGANKTSRLQTEFGSFHVWWGPYALKTGKTDYPNCRDFTGKDGGKDGWHIWPYKEEIRRHFEYAAEAYGVLPHIKFKTNVSKIDIVGDKDKEDRFYKFTVDSLDKPGESDKINVSCIFHYPGSLTQNRIIDYPGEDIFGGEIRYGMNDDTPYEKLKDATVAILGNGAFAVENARTVLECGGVKGYIVTRRKNLASPRMPCWFVHQAPLPTPGRYILRMFDKMYRTCGFGDPWDYWSVHADKERKNVTIMQNSRFGIGDVTFLMHAWGLLEYKVGVLKRCSKHTLHLSDGTVLEGVTIILKALGLLGDWAVDKLQKMNHMKGSFIQGDWRRFLAIDATGMNAANFTTFSTGIGTTGFSMSQKYLWDYPHEWYKVEADVMSKLPEHKEQPELEKPAYVTDVKFSMVAGIVIDAAIPGQAALMNYFPAYKYYMYHTAHDTDRTLAVAMKEWHELQEEWKSRGHKHDYVPYPYTKEDIKVWFDEYNAAFDNPDMIHIDGPVKNDRGCGLGKFSIPDTPIPDKMF